MNGAIVEVFELRERAYDDMLIRIARAVEPFTPIL